MADQRFWNPGRRKLLAKTLCQLDVVLAAAGASGQVFAKLPPPIVWAVVVAIPALLGIAIAVWPDEREGE